MNPADLPNRIARRIQPAADGCWLWTGTLNDAGYGHIAQGYNTVRAHRLVYTLLIDEIPDGLQLDHLCRVRRCVNPAHLEPVTNRENQMRSPLSITARNVAKTHCPQGHPYSGDNLYIRPCGGRRCRKCHANRVALKRAERRFAA